MKRNGNDLDNPPVPGSGPRGEAMVDDGNVDLTQKRWDTNPGGYNGRQRGSSTMGRQVYDEEFKGSAVEMVVKQRNTMSSVARRLGANYHTLREWVNTAKSRASESLIPKDIPLEQPVRELEKENARLRMERDILKKRRHTSRRSSCEVRVHQGARRGA